MAVPRALSLLALLRAAVAAGAGGPSASDPPNVSRFANLSAFTISGPARGGSLRGSQQAPSTLKKVIAHGDAECSGKYAAVQTAAQCAAAAQALWPTGLLYPCYYPVWADNLVEVDEPNEPQGCLLVTNAGNGCGLRFNAAGHGQVCEEPGLSCVVVCGEGDDPATTTEEGPHTTEWP